MLHVCADHPGARTLNNSECQDWGKLYRAAVLESDRSRLLQRIEQAEAAILERSRSLSKSAGNNRKEQEVIARALQILSLLRKAGQEPLPHAIAARKRSAHHYTRHLCRDPARVVDANGVCTHDRLRGQSGFFFP